MNRSMSKIRHIQEANLKLEKRLLKEVDVATDSVANVNSTGGGLSNQEKLSLAKFFTGFQKLIYDFKQNPSSKYNKSTYSTLVLSQSDINNLKKPPYNLYAIGIESGKPLAYSCFNPDTNNFYNIKDKYADGFSIQKMAKGLYVYVDRAMDNPEFIPLMGNEDSILTKLEELNNYIRKQSFNSK